MEDSRGYQIQKEATFENGRGFALAHNPTAQEPYVILHFSVMPDGERNVYDLTTCRGILPPEKEFEKFLSAYDYVYHIPRQAEGQKQTDITYYRYYTRYPLDNNTFPNSKELGLVEIAPYAKQTLVEGNTIRTWGEVVYTKPLPEKTVEKYELKPSRLNSNMKERIAEQAQVIGKWEDSRHIDDQKRLTWFNSDFGSYELKPSVTPEQLINLVAIVKELQAERRQKPSIAAQLQEGAKQAKEHREPPAKKDGPAHQDR